MSFGDALDREADWLKTTGDTLPDLTTVFDVIQARWPRTPTTTKHGLYVLHDQTAMTNARTTNQHARNTYGMQLLLLWRFKTVATAQPAEAEQAALDDAVDAVLGRVLGLLEDHTHGSRFLSVAEDQTRVHVDITDAEQGLKAGEWIARIRYTADDFDVVN